MNYIKLLNAAFEKFYFDDRLNPTHISLYMALFQEWNSRNLRDSNMDSKKGTIGTLGARGIPSYDSKKGHDRSPRSPRDPYGFQKGNDMDPRDSKTKKE